MKNKIARIYMRVSTDEQNLLRQERMIDDVRRQGFYIAGVYSEKVSGVSQNRPELSRMIADLQVGDYVFAESIDRITRLPPAAAEQLINEILSKGAKIQVPEIFDFSEIQKNLENQELPKYLLEPLFDAFQKMFLRIALNIAHDDYKKRRQRQKEGIALAKAQGKYKGRQANLELHKKIIQMRFNGISIRQTAELLNCSITTVLRVTKEFRQQTAKSK